MWHNANLCTCMHLFLWSANKHDKWTIILVHLPWGLKSLADNILPSARFRWLVACHLVSGSEGVVDSGKHAAWRNAFMVKSWHLSQPLLHTMFTCVTYAARSILVSKHKVFVRRDHVPTNLQLWIPPPSSLDTPPGTWAQSQCHSARETWDLTVEKGRAS